ncbi:MAG TPA: MFS transporter [Kineosporiaceae bacterium]|nr:MFS transporter [Kineosporiaceae bacterium]
MYGLRLKKRFTLTSLGAAYTRLWTANVVSNIGDGCSLVAFPWLASTLTRDPLLISGALVASRLPWGLFSLFVGVVVDRFDRRYVIVIANLVRGLVMAGLAAFLIADALSIWALYAFILVLGAFEVLADTASGALLPRIVPPEQLESANGRLWSAQSAANNILGPPLGGALLALGLAVPFFVDAASFLLSAGLLLLLPGQFRVQRDQSEPRASWRAQLREGFAFVWSVPALKVLFLSEAVVNATATMAISTYVLYVREVLHLSSVAYGLLMTAGAIGVITGGLAAAGITERLSLHRVVILFFAVATLAHLLTGLLPIVWVVAVGAILFTFVAMLWNVVTVSLTQRIVPDALMGRVGGVNRWFSFGLMPIGALAAAGVIASFEPYFGRTTALRMPFVVAAGVFLVTGLLSAPAFTERALVETTS